MAKNEKGDDDYFTPEQVLEFTEAVTEFIAERDERRRLKVEKLTAEVKSLEDGDFSDGTWQNAPEAIPGLDSCYFLTGEGGVKHAIITHNPYKEGSTYARGRAGSHRLFMDHPALWEQLNPLQRDSVCRLVWPTWSGSFIIIDAVSEDVVGTHVLNASKEPPEFDSQGSDLDIPE